MGWYMTSLITTCGRSKSEFGRPGVEGGERRQLRLIRM